MSEINPLEMRPGMSDAERERVRAARRADDAERLRRAQEHAAANRDAERPAPIVIDIDAMLEPRPEKRDKK